MFHRANSCRWLIIFHIYPGLELTIHLLFSGVSHRFEPIKGKVISCCCSYFPRLWPHQLPNSKEHVELSGSPSLTAPRSWSFHVAAVWFEISWCLVNYRNAYKQHQLTWHVVKTYWGLLHGNGVQTLSCLCKCQQSNVKAFWILSHLLPLVMDLFLYMLYCFNKNVYPGVGFVR